MFKKLYTTEHTVHVLEALVLKQMLATLACTIWIGYYLLVPLGPCVSILPTCSVYLGISLKCHLSKRWCWNQPVAMVGRRMRKQGHNHREVTLMAASSFSQQPALWQTSPLCPSAVGSLLILIWGATLSWVISCFLNSPLIFSQTILIWM